MTIQIGYQIDNDMALLDWFTKTNQFNPNYKEVKYNSLKVRNVGVNKPNPRR
jgi:hypothetical protein